MGYQHAARRGSRDSDARLDTISAAPEAGEGRLRTRKRLIFSVPRCRAVRATMSPIEELVGEGCANQGHLRPTPYVGDDPLECLPKDLAPLLLQCLVRGGLDLNRNLNFPESERKVRNHVDEIIHVRRTSERTKGKRYLAK